MKKPTVILLVAIGLLSLGVAAEPPAAPEQVRPVLIGTALPELALHDVDGKSVELGELGSGRAVLIFYRGGW